MMPPPDPPALSDRDRRRWMAGNAIAFVGLIFFVLYFLTSFRFRVLFADENRQIDFMIWYLLPQYILEHLRYPASATGDWVHTIFPYLPSAAAMMLPLQAVPRVVSFGLWLALQAASFAIVIVAAARLSGAMRLHGWVMIALAAALLTENALSWDLRSHNNNLVYLALVMLGLLARRTWISALLLAASFNLKLYSGPILVALAWRREYRLAAAMAVAAVLIAVLVPLAVFGPKALPQLARDWIEQVLYTASPVNQSSGPASLYRSAATLLGADPSSTAVAAAVRSAQAAWIVVVAGYFLLAGRSQPADPLRRDQARLADMCVALVAPLPLSTWFIPYHGVVMLPAFMLLIVVMVGGGFPKWPRGVALAACIACMAVRFSVKGWDYRSLVFLAEFTFVVIALLAVRRSLMQPGLNSASADRG